VVRSGECEDVFSHDNVRLAQDRIRERQVDAEALVVDLAREPALSAIAEAVLPRALEVHPGLLNVRLNFDLDELRSRCSSATLNPAGVAYVRGFMHQARHRQPVRRRWPAFC